LARIILSHALLESIRFVMSRKECRYIYGLINKPSSRKPNSSTAARYRPGGRLDARAERQRNGGFVTPTSSLPTGRPALCHDVLVNSSKPDRRPRKDLNVAVFYHLIELGVTNLRLRQDYPYQGGTQLAQDQRRAEGGALWSI
jgi:hypothetical protein